MGRSQVYGEQLPMRMIFEMEFERRPCCFLAIYKGLREIDINQTYRIQMQVAIVSARACLLKKTDTVDL